MKNAYFFLNTKWKPQVSLDRNEVWKQFSKKQKSFFPSCHLVYFSIKPSGLCSLRSILQRLILDDAHQEIQTVLSHGEPVSSHYHLLILLVTNTHLNQPVCVSGEREPLIPHFMLLVNQLKAHQVVKFGFKDSSPLPHFSFSALLLLFLLYETNVRFSFLMLTCA